MTVSPSTFQPSPEASQQAYIKSLAEYQKIYRRSVDDPEGFWGEMAKQLDWFQPWRQVLTEDFKEGRQQWFLDGKLNVTYNCLDRHVKTWRKNKAALVWE
ncbi:MAG: acetyl-coenzyme A synthetase N-terminal domain-containing protein, partial [Chloroflexota bacterium]